MMPTVEEIKDFMQDYPDCEVEVYCDLWGEGVGVSTPEQVMEELAKESDHEEKIVLEAWNSAPTRIVAEFNLRSRR